jgi:DegV family protein with EDD domain
MTFKKIKFVTDSTCDIPPELVQKWGIGIVPAFVNYGGNSYADDGKELIREEFYARLLTMTETPTTAAPPPGLTEKVIKEAFEGADHLMVLTAPAALSGIYNSMRLGASSLPPDCVTLIDSGTVTMALGWQVLVGAEVAAATGDVDKVIDAINRVRAHQKLYAGLATMEFLRRSGRVSWALAGIGALLQIKPMVEVKDGVVFPLARVRTFGKVMQELIALTRAQAPLDKLAILHANNPDGARDMQNQLADVIPPETLVINITTVIGTHIGPGALGVATVSKGWRAE